MEINLPKNEEDILKFWKEKKIFEKSLEKTKDGPKLVFYEGPPFANGLPGIHHLLARAFKDVILRYKTMQGFFVERKAGWDTHGLPTEMEAEKKLGIKTKKEIEKLGIEKFIEECKNNVFTYKKEWEEFTERIGFWLDLENAYITCSNEYIESLWWIIKRIWEKGYLYQDYKVVPYCPRCGTSLSSHEVAQGYEKIKEPALYVKFKIKEAPKTYNLKPNTYLLVWTTTPWTLPGNVAIAINPEFIYIKVKINNQYFLLAKERIEAFNIDGEIIQEFKGKELLGLKYESLYKIQDTKYDIRTAYQIIPGDFVSIEEGTGLVHIAPAFGEEDMEASKKNNLPILMTVDEEGKFKAGVQQWAGMFVKTADPLIIEDLKKRNLLFKEEIYEHDYPFCWRCDSPLLYYAKNSWFIKMIALKTDLIKNNQKINWIPGYLKEGRFGEWLKEVKDWNLSRERYWGTPLPVWQCQTGKNHLIAKQLQGAERLVRNSKLKTQKLCDNIKVIGSIEELEKLSSRKVKELHRPFIDKITFKCEKCGNFMQRVPEVADCWFDSGSMPFAQWHYPFESDSISSQGSDNYPSSRAKLTTGRSGVRNKESLIPLPKNFPADFICEGIDQTRGWFYTLLAVSTLLGLGNPYKNVISHGLVLDVKGQKMSKSRGNVIWPSQVIEKYGADLCRFYFYTINPVAEPKRFDFKDLDTLYRKFFDTLINCQNFFLTYIDQKFQPNKNFKSKNLLDLWIISRLENLKFRVTKGLNNYDVVGAARIFLDFVENLSNWYIRRSRKRFQNPKTKIEKEEVSQTLYFILSELTKLLAPFCPFISEKLYQQFQNKEAESVHLTEYPKPDKRLINQKLEEKMIKIREIVTLALAERVKAKIKVRQPLVSLKIKNHLIAKQLQGAKRVVRKSEIKNDKELLELIKEEVNVKKVLFDGRIKEEIELDTKITTELKEEGIVRDIIRNIQEMRKKADLRPNDKILVSYLGTPDLNHILVKNKKFILDEAKVKNLRLSEREETILDVEREIEIDQQKLWLGIKRI